MRGPEAGVMQLYIFNGKVGTTPHKQQTWTMYFQISGRFTNRGFVPGFYFGRAQRWEQATGNALDW